MFARPLCASGSAARVPQASCAARLRRMRIDCQPSIGCGFSSQAFACARARNDEITAAKIRLIDLDGTMRPDPVATRDILKSLNGQELSLICVNDRASPPICRIFKSDSSMATASGAATAPKPTSKAATGAGLNQQQQQQQQLKARVNEHTNESKVYVFSWMIGTHDLEHRLAGAIENLKEGYMVEIHLGNARQRRQKAGIDDKLRVLGAIRDALGPVATEWSDMVVRGGLTRLYWKVRKEVLQKHLHDVAAAAATKRDEEHLVDAESFIKIVADNPDAPELQSLSRKERKRLEKQAQFISNQDTLRRKKEKFEQKAVMKLREGQEAARIRAQLDRNKSRRS